MRDQVMLPLAPSVEEAAGRFASLFATTFSTVVLARVFLVLPFERLPAEERAFALRFVPAGETLEGATPVLTLLGTCGRDAAWAERRRSAGHLAIPLVNRSFVQGVPMLARLLADLELDLGGLDEGLPIVSRRMLGGKNGTFFVHDATTAADAAGRLVIPSREFVMGHGVRTVFGMGGAYLDGTLAVSIVFTEEVLERGVVDRYPSFISNFKMATAALLEAGNVFRAPREGS